MASLISYLRVSLEKQGISGLGMEAQREAVSHYVAAHGALLAEYTEVESGRRHKNRLQRHKSSSHSPNDRFVIPLHSPDGIL